MERQQGLRTLICQVLTTDATDITDFFSPLSAPIRVIRGFTLFLVWRTTRQVQSSKSKAQEKFHIRVHPWLKVKG
jgi:hypothetical protein